ncbi:hypothetical protein RA268_28055, partial [Pseudomonas syringae pv. tagetis]
MVGGCCWGCWLGLVGCFWVWVWLFVCVWGVEIVVVVVGGLFFLLVFVLFVVGGVGRQVACLLDQLVGTFAVLLLQVMWVVARLVAVFELHGAE